MRKKPIYVKDVVTVRGKTYEHSIERLTFASEQETTAEDALMYMANALLGLSKGLGMSLSQTGGKTNYGE